MFRKYIEMRPFSHAEIRAELEHSPKVPIVDSEDRELGFVREIYLGERALYTSDDRRTLRRWLEAHGLELWEGTESLWIREVVRYLEN